MVRQRVITNRITKRITIVKLSYYLKCLYVGRINETMTRRCKDSSKLQLSHTPYSPMQFSKIICLKCFKEVEENDEIFRKYNRVGYGSKYMHLVCAERYNYV
jgi:hypothetical protein